MSEAIVKLIPSNKFSSIASKVIEDTLCELQEKNPNISFICAGGKSPQETYKLLAGSHRVQWGNIKLLLSDERFVPQDDERSNSLMIRKSLLCNLKSDGPCFFPFDTTLSSPQNSAISYHNTLVKESILNPDLTILGIGNDGHTAGIFPNSTLIDNNNQLFSAAQERFDGLWGITLTPSFLRRSKKIIFLVRGSEKKDIIANILDPKSSPIRFPAKLFLGHNSTLLIENDANKEDSSLHGQG